MEFGFREEVQLYFFGNLMLSPLADHLGICTYFTCGALKADCLGIYIYSLKWIFDFLHGILQLDIGDLFYIWTLKIFYIWRLEIYFYIWRLEIYFYMDSKFVSKFLWFLNLFGELGFEVDLALQLRSEQHRTLRELSILISRSYS